MSADSFQSKRFKKKSPKNKLSVYQAVWVKIRIDVLLVLILLHAVR